MGWRVRKKWGRLGRWYTCVVLVPVAGVGPREWSCFVPSGVLPGSIVHRFGGRLLLSSRAGSTDDPGHGRECWDMGEATPSQVREAKLLHESS